LLNDVQVLDYDLACAEEFGKVRCSPRRKTLRHALSGLWEAQYRNKNAAFPLHEALSGILGFWVSGVTSQ
jgi:hypothetical protein